MANEPIRVPYTAQGVPIDVTPPEGYAAVSEHPGGFDHNGSEVTLLQSDPAAVPILGVSGTGSASDGDFEYATHGPELVDNGEFTTGDLTGWSLYQNGAGVVSNNVANSAEITFPSDATGSFCTLNQSFSTEVGKEYSLSGSIISAIVSGDPFYAIRKADDALATVNTENCITKEIGNDTVLFTATSSTTYVILQVNASVGQENVVSFDNVSVREVVQEWVKETSTITDLGSSWEMEGPKDFAEFNGSTDYLDLTTQLLAAPDVSDVTVRITTAMRVSEGTQGALFGGVSQWDFFLYDGTTSDIGANGGSSYTVTVDGDVVTTRTELKAALSDEAYHTIIVANADMSSWITLALFNLQVGTGGFEAPADAFMVEFDWNSNGTWDHIIVPTAANAMVDTVTSVELVEDPEFDTPVTEWTEGTGWAAGGGVATYNGLNGTQSIHQDFSFTIGVTYLIVIVVLSNEGIGTNVVDMGAGGGSLRVNGDHLLAGKHEFVWTAPSTTSGLSIYGRDGEVFSLDSVSIVEVLPNEGTGDLTAQQATEVWPNATDSDLPPLTLWGVGSLGSDAPTMTRYGSPWTEETVLGGELVVNGGFEGVGSPWTEYNGGSIGGGVAVMSSGEGVYTPTDVLPTDALSVIRYTVISNNTATILLNRDTNIDLPASVGTHTVFIPVIPGETASRVWFIANGGTITIDNVSVKEVTTAGNAYKRLSYADCLAIVPYEGGVVPKWAKPDGPCLLKELATWPNNQVWVPSEFGKTEKWRTKLTDECGEDETSTTFEGELVTFNGNVVFNN
jgi:hypothetical protein